MHEVPFCLSRFPESESPTQFWENLVAGTDMVTENDRRWPVGLHGTPGRFGKLIEYHLFDAPFFSVHGKQASVRSSPVLDPCSTMLSPVLHTFECCICYIARQLFCSAVALALPYCSCILFGLSDSSSDIQGMQSFGFLEPVLWSGPAGALQYVMGVFRALHSGLQWTLPDNGAIHKETALLQEGCNLDQFLL